MRESQGRLRILVVDDDDVDRMAVIRALRKAGVEGPIDEIADAKDAERAISCRELDCIFLDYHLPTMDGLQILRAARIAGIQTPIIVLTGQGDEALAVEIMKCGASDYMPKHLVTPDRLYHSISHALRVRRAEEREIQARATVERQAEQLTHLVEACIRIYGTLSLEEMMADVAVEARALVGARHCVTVLRPSPGQRSVLIHEATPEHEGTPSCRVVEVAEDAIAKLVGPFQRARHLTPEALATEGEWTFLHAVSALPPAEHDLLVAPMRRRDGTAQGLVILADRIDGSFNANDELILLQLAQIAAIASENAILYERLQEAGRARDDVLAIVSHDLRNPLHAFSMNGTLLSRSLEHRTAEFAKELEILRRMRQGVSAMNRLIDDLVDAARLDAEPLPITQAKEDAVAIIRSAIEAASPLAERKQIRLIEGDATPNVHIFADRDRILQLFSNLIGNALKFTSKDGRVTLSLETKNDSAIFSVADTGCGIPPEHLDRLFDRYWKAAKKSREGTGLGLYIARGIVEAHGGTIGVSSKVGEGTTIRFVLPISR